jgi:ferredoxin-nitrate reductase
MAATQTVLWSRILDRLAGPDPPKLIVVDPRKTATAKKATVHLSPYIGTNMAVLNGLQNLLIEKGYINDSYIEKHVYGFPELKATVRDYTPKRVQELSGVRQEDLIAAAELIGKAESLLSTALQGVYQSHQATASACQINNINLILGHIGKPGSGVYQMNGQPTAQNNRETGCNGEFPGFRNRMNQAHMEELARMWNIELERLPHWNQPTDIMQMMHYIEDDTMGMFWVSGMFCDTVSPPHRKTSEAKGFNRDESAR